MVGELKVVVRRNLGHVTAQAVFFSRCSGTVESSALIGIVTIEADRSMKSPVWIRGTMRVVAGRAVQSSWLIRVQNDFLLLLEAWALRQTDGSESNDGGIIRFNWPPHLFSPTMALTTTIDRLNRRHR